MERQDTSSTMLGRKFAAYLLKQAHKFKINVAATLETGEAEAVHHLRVASRRLSEPLLVLKESVPGRTIMKNRRELGDWRRAFRRVRDLDVLGETLEEASKSGAQINLDGLKEELGRHRDAKLRSAWRECGGMRLSRLLDRTRGLGHDIQADAGLRAACALGDLFERRAQALRELTISQEEDADLHPARIAVKKMRYCAELVQKVGIRDESALIEELTAMQGILGHWNDQMIAVRWLGRFASQRKNLINKSGLCRDALKAVDIIIQSSFSDRRHMKQRWPGMMDALDLSAGPGNGFHRPLRPEHELVERA
jgi:CHAD domain-containing protein